MSDDTIDNIIELAKLQRGISLVPSLPARPLAFADMANWDAEDVPERRWAVYNRIPLLQTTLFSGEGAAGKSTVMLHLCAAVVLGRDWLGGLPERGPAIFIDCEDDTDEIHRRLAAVRHHCGTTFDAMAKGDLRLLSLAGQDAVLAAPNRNGRIEPTALFRQLLEAAGDIKPKLISIASLANVFGGSEIDRSQVQQFIGLTTRLAVTAQGAVVLISHPSLTGINTGSGISGSTQWHNAVRARFVLKSVNPEPGEQPDNDLRQIEFKKNQFGPVSETIVLRYRDGMFLPEAGISNLDQVAREARAEDVFLDILRRFTRENRKVGHHSGTSYAPALFARESEARDAKLGKKELEAAMRRLFKNRKIANEAYGRSDRPHYRLVIAPYG